MNVLDFQLKKQSNQKITLITCYDYTSACIANASAVDCLLVGDSLAMTMHGHASTVTATMEMMSLHTAAVSQGAKNKFIVADLPFLSYRQSLSDTVENAGCLIRAGANAVKLEGATGNLDFISHLVSSGIPVMGHLGLTPQSVNVLGGFKVQAKTESAAQQLIEDAVSLQNAGCFAIVLECVPSSIAKSVTEKLTIPTIGIGAGKETDGQVLVWQDFLGLNESHFKFVKKYLNTACLIKNSINDYVADVTTEEFPADEHCFKCE